MVRFKEGKDLAEVAVIGRNMDAVRAAGERLNVAGISTRIFEPSLAAKNEFSQLAKKLQDRIPYHAIPSTDMYKENMHWVDKIVHENITIIDVGNSKGIIEKSRFYDDEVLSIFGEANQ